MNNDQILLSDIEESLNERVDTDKDTEYFAYIGIDDDDREDELLAVLEEKIYDYYQYVDYVGLQELWWKCYLNYYAPLQHLGQVQFYGVNNEYVSVSINRFRNNIQHLHVMTTKNRPRFEPISLNSDYKSQAQTLALTSGVLEHYMRDKRAERYLKRANEHAVVFGEGFMSLEWDPSAGGIFEVAEDGTPTFEGDIELHNYTPNNVIRNVNCEYYDDSEWVMLRRFVDKNLLALKYNDPDVRDHIKSLTTSSHSDQGIASNFNISQSFTDSDEIALYTFYHKPCEILPVGRKISFVDGMILDDAPLPDLTIPVFRETPAEWVGMPFGFSPSFDMLPIQEQINHSYSIVASNQNAFGVQSILVPNDSNVNVTEISKGLSFISYDAINGEKPEALNLVQTPAEIFESIDRMTTEMDVISGLSAVSHGQLPSAGLSGTSLFMLESRAIEFNSGLQASHVALIEDVGTAIVNVLKINAKSPRVMRMAGKTKKNLQKEFVGDDLKDINRVLVSVGNPVVDTTAGRMELATLYMNTVGSDGNPLITPEQHLQFIETGNLEQATERVTQENMKIRNENEIMSEVLADEQELEQARLLFSQAQSGISQYNQAQQASAAGMATPEIQAILSQPKPVVPFAEIYGMFGLQLNVTAVDSHVEHIREHATVMSAPDLPPAVAFITMLMIEHHITLLKETSPELLGALGQPSLAPQPQPQNQQPPSAMATPPPQTQDGNAQAAAVVQPPKGPGMPKDMLTGNNPGNLDKYI